MLSSYRPLAAVAFALALAACSNSPTAEDLPMNPSPPAADATCDAEPARQYVGETATSEVVESARVASGSRFARTLKPGQMVTMEHNAERLNIDVDKSNVITNVRCG